MNWQKKGHIIIPNGQYDWSVSHAQVPIVMPRGEELRVIFGTRDSLNRTRPAWVDVVPDDPWQVVRVCGKPLLELGAPGTFDDSGVMPSCLLFRDGLWYLYYIGWNRCRVVPFRLAIGLATSKDGQKFERYSEGPILERDTNDPYWVSCPFVRADDDLWQMWYISCLGWTKDGPRYHVKAAVSHDGLSWKKIDVPCVDLNDDELAIACPRVIREGRLWKMWYSYRSSQKGYRIGYAESTYGLEWKRRDSEVGIDISAEGWDSEMICYPWLHDYKGDRFMLYNGNGFGKSGIGYAVLE